jgi:phosphate transport system permease protein
MKDAKRPEDIEQEEAFSAEREGSSSKASFSVKTGKADDSVYEGIESEEGSASDAVTIENGAIRTDFMRFTKENAERHTRRRKIKDIISQAFTYLFSSFGVLILVAIMVFIFTNGSSVLSWDFITGDYNTKTESYSTSVRMDPSNPTFAYETPDGIYFSDVWGVAFADSTDNQKQPIVKIYYVDEASPLSEMTSSATGETEALEEGEIFGMALLFDESSSSVVVSSSMGAEAVADGFDKGAEITMVNVTTVGGGIRGSLLTTVYMILITLAICLPLGITTAVYLEEYAKPGKFRDAMARIIDVAGGVPSIIYGLVGVIIFIPFVSGITGSTSGGSILAGALTMTVMLLPVVVSSSCEALREIPDGYAKSSLALGASKTQTVFKVVLPNAIIGLLTGALLATGRIIGESAALIYACSASIQDNISVTAGSATLAVHIWSLLNQEVPDYAACSAVAIIILIVDFILNLLLKLVAYEFRKKVTGKTGTGPIAYIKKLFRKKPKEAPAGTEEA